MIPVAQRTERIQPQPMFRILAEASKIEDSGQSVLHLEVGGTGGFQNDLLLEIFRELATAPRLSYCESAGTTGLRSAIAKEYIKEKQAYFDADCVAVAPANALIHQILAVTCDPGDTVLLPDPWFPTYKLAVDYNELRLETYKLREKQGWKPSVKEIATILEKDNSIRVIILNSPSNPLGTVFDPTLINQIMQLAHQHQVVCVFDETYKNLIYKKFNVEIEHLPTNCYLYSFSKDAAAAGLRMGCLVGEPTLIKKVNDFTSMFTSCYSPFLQDVILEYMRRGGSFHKTMRTEIPRRVDRVHSILGSSDKLSYVLPSGGFYLFLNISKTGLTGEQFATNLLHERYVCVCPGTAFGSIGEQYVRLTLSGLEEELYRACKEVVKFCY
jgi:aspartate/methionine/tyrosine aminotransferase